MNVRIQTATEIAVLDDYQQAALAAADWGRLPAEARLTVFNDHVPADQQDVLVERLRPFQVICAMRERTPFPRALLERLPNLKLLLTGGMNNAAIDVAAAAELGVTVCGTRAPGHATAELTWGLILALARRIPQEDRALRHGRWQTGIGHDLNGKTLGVIGLGRLGARVATVGLAFGMRVLAWSQNLSAGRAAEVGVERVGKDTLLREADVITVHLRLSERSRGLLAAPELALLKPNAYLINTSRGPIVDQQALLEALRGGRLGGAGLDVYDREPLPADHPLLALDNVVLTPHIGFVTAETYAVFYGEMLDNILAYLAGSPRRVIAAPGGPAGV